jgi:hypothetical protein
MRTIYRRAKFKTLRHFSIWRYKHLVEKTSPLGITPDDASSLSVAMLCGRSTLFKGIGAVKSFYRFFPENTPFHWHDDGSLSRRDQDLIRRHLPGSKIILRDEADENVQPYLERNGYKELAALRKEYVHLRKLTDVVFFGRKKLLQFDSDVLCLQRPLELLASMQGEGGFLSRYNKDFGPAMAYRDADLESFLSGPVLPCFNSGLFLTLIEDRDELYWLAERLLSNHFETLRGYVLEQTLWAVWCTKRGGSPLPDEYDCTFRLGRTGRRSLNRVVTQHYCAFASALFFEEFVTKVYPSLAPPNYLSRVIIKSINSGVFNVAH